MSITSKSLLLLGKCITLDLKATIKVVVQRMELDEKLLMYFPEKTEYFVHDAKQKCKTGDIVLIRELPEPMSLTVTHEVEKIVYELGNTIDPVSGKRCAGTEYIDEIQRVSELFGKKLPFLEAESDKKKSSSVA